MMYKLGQEFSHYYNRVLLSSIVRAGPSPQISILLSSNGQLPGNSFVNNNPLYLLREKVHKDKYLGFTPTQLESLLQKSDACIFESDGARGCSLKAHNNKDPYVPEFSTHVIIFVGADIINTPVKAEYIHRQNRFISQWNIPDNTEIDIDLVTQVLTSNEGYMSKIPKSTQVRYFVNKADLFPKKAEDLAKALNNITPHPVYWGSVRDFWWKACS